MFSLIFRSTYSKPILLLGNGVRTSGADELIREFVHATNIPVLTTMNGVDLAQDDLHIGFIGTHGNRIANMIINECDLVISIGARLGIRQVGRAPQCFAPKADLVRCDIDEYELSRNIKEGEKKYHTDAKDFVRMLMTENVGDYTKWKQQCMTAKKMLEGYDKQPGNCAVEMIGSLLPINPIVSVDVGMNQCWTAQSLILKGYLGRILISGGYGTMGCGLPYAVGASIANKSQNNYCITGDGGMQMNIQELETIKRENLPVKIFVLNNRVLGKISETQYFEHDKRFANTTTSGGYTVPSFEKISEAYGIRAVTLESYMQLEKYEEWIVDDKPCLFDICLPAESFLTPKIKFETGKIRPEINHGIENKVKKILCE